MSLWTRTPVVITLASLPTAFWMALGLNTGRQGSMIDNLTAKLASGKVLIRVKLGISPDANRGIYVWFVRGDGAGNRDDNAGPSDAPCTFKNCDLLGSLQTGITAATGDVLTGIFEFVSPGIEWTIGISHDTVVDLDATPGNHLVEYWGTATEAA